VPTIQADPLGSPADRDHHRPRERRRGRWQLWRSPDDQPRWSRPALLGIAVLASFLYAWNITRAGYAPFYSVAVKSMSVSWKAFFYGAFDPKATITIDKLAGSFLPQALSARIFGFSAWSLALPQVIEGVLSVLVMYRVVRRWAGAPAGLLAAGIFALTPIAASMFGHSMEDGALTCCLVLAAGAYQRAVMEARLRSLLMAGAWVGLGFQAKMLQAWMVLPALALAYLVAAPVPLRRRLWQVAVAGIVTLAVSLSWIALYTFTPASDRPYIDGSTNNSAIAMVFGYNGLERFGISVNGAVTSGPGVTTSNQATGNQATGNQATGNQAGSAAPERAPAAGGIAGSAPPATGAGTRPTGPGTAGTAQEPIAAGANGAGRTSPSAGAATPGNGRAAASGGSFGSGWTKLLGSEYGPEIGWLYPLAVLALVFGLVWARRARRDDQLRAGFVMWGAWLLTYGLIFSKMSSIPHTAYVASLAPPLAALPAAGIVIFWRAFRAGGWRAWVLPAAVAAELAWALFLWHYYPGFLPWARDAAAIAGAVAIVVMVAALLSRRPPGRLVTVGLTVGAAAMIAAPGAWAASVLDTAYGGSSFNASAGPAGGFGGAGTTGGAPSGASGTSGPGGARSYAGARAGDYGDYEFAEGDRGSTGMPATVGGGLTTSATTTLTSAQQRLYAYISAHRDGASYLMAVSSWEEAGEYILATGQEVLNMGGFSGTVPEPTLAQVKNLVRTGQLRYFLISGSGGGGGGGLAGGSGTSASTAIDSWVASVCAEVPAKDYNASTASATTGAGTLYACAPSS
jgi:4-amino-4-deoxy-L-arabinose transferase-like glycosyltransferase